MAKSEKDGVNQDQNSSEKKKEDAGKKYLLEKQNLQKAETALKSAIDMSKNADSTMKRQKASSKDISENNEKIANIGKKVEEKKEELKEQKKDLISSIPKSEEKK